MREIAGFFEQLDQDLGSRLALESVARYGNVSGSRHKSTGRGDDMVQGSDRGMRTQVLIGKVSHTYISL